MAEKLKPLKRDPALVEFSKDHHFGLLLVWKIRQGLKAGVDSVRISKYLLHFFDMDLFQHFKDEEDYLFIKLQPSDFLRINAEKEHSQLRFLVDNIRYDTTDATLLSEFAELLESHIRFEERELFSQLQKSMTQADLLDLLLTIPARPHINDADWKDHFWIWKKEAGK